MAETYVCARCLTRFTEAEIRYRDRAGATVEPPRLREVARVRDYARAAWLGDPAPLDTTLASAVARMHAQGIHAVCPQGHRIPQAIFDRPTLVVALIGEQSAGKSVYLATLIEEIVQKGRLVGHGLTFHLDESCADAFAQRFQDFLHRGGVPVQTERHPDSGVSLEPYLVAVHTESGPVANLLFFDSDGGTMARLADHGAHNPHVYVSDIVFFFVPPAALGGLGPGGTARADQRQSLTTTQRTLSTTLDALQAVAGQGRGKAAAFVVSKSDDIASGYLGDYENLTDDLDLEADVPLTDIVDTINEDSGYVRDFVQRHHGTGLVHAVEAYFDHVSFHLTSCVQGPAYDGRFMGGREARRVVDPLLVVLASFQLLGTADSARGLPWRRS